MARHWRFIYQYGSTQLFERDRRFALWTVLQNGDAPFMEIWAEDERQAIAVAKYIEECR